MKREKRLPFQPDMAIATANGHKNKTRRLMDTIQLQAFGAKPDNWTFEKMIDEYAVMTRPGRDDEGALMRTALVKCPYGKIGEQFRAVTTWGVTKKCDHMKPTQLSEALSVWSYFDSPEPPAHIGKLRPARFVPRHLYEDFPLCQITDIRAERLQQITEDDVLSEGVTNTVFLTRKQRTQAFAKLWDRINGKRAPWRRNDWVWVIRYQIVTPFQSVSSVKSVDERN